MAYKYRRDLYDSCRRGIGHGLGWFSNRLSPADRIEDQLHPARDAQFVINPKQSVWWLNIDLLESKSHFNLVLYLKGKKSIADGIVFERRFRCFLTCGGRKRSNAA